LELLGARGRTRALGSADRPSTSLVQSLARTPRTLRLNGIDPKALTTLDPGNQLLEALAEMLEDYPQALAKRHRYDQAQLYTEATGLIGGASGSLPCAARKCSRSWPAAFFAIASGPAASSSAGKPPLPRPRITVREHDASAHLAYLLRHPRQSLGRRSRSGRTSAPRPNLQPCSETCSGGDYPWTRWSWPIAPSSPTWISSTT